MLVYVLGLLFLCACVFYKNCREPYDGTPSEYVQAQAGEIQQLHDTIQKTTLTEALLNSLQSDNDQTTDKINQLQANLPTKPN